jgi:hypothetical protein
MRRDTLLQTPAVVSFQGLRISSTILILGIAFAILVISPVVTRAALQMEVLALQRTAL